MVGDEKANDCNSQGKKLKRALEDKLAKVRNDAVDDNKLPLFEGVDVLMEK